MMFTTSKKKRWSIVFLSMVLLCTGMLVFGTFPSSAAARSVNYSKSFNSATRIVGAPRRHVKSKSSVSLSHTPYGDADLWWNARAEKLTVIIKLAGLAPHSIHPAHIHMGSCAGTAAGDMVYALHDVSANSAGSAVSTTIIDHVKDVPNQGWAIYVHNGPTLNSSDEAVRIACGEVQLRHGKKGANLHLLVHLGGSGDANQMAYGSAQLVLRDYSLTVTVTVHGLVPGSTHPAHIHAGACKHQLPGTIVYELKDLVADMDGNASSVTVINDVHSIAHKQWYLNVHYGTDLTTQTGFDPIACGNITSSH